ncbi:hypothetical protein OGH69_13815 [Flavobacterium sp. MFBS3-15]|uniref:hypothetical protein n=1 Tax=Flavobacterium sp. MFBS3-15 TaxID=2989816 RepID=UPI00223619FF|nr:hypothetical protein [Flavobacterium sp. MFBS3-15]MCW4470048.1 hypothetical protein [Flavobacterium sp. MFBS3-15]
MSYYQKNLEAYTRGSMGFNALAVMVQSCIGGIAAMMVLQNGTSPAQMIQLFFVVALCSGFNGAVLSQQKPKLVFDLLLLSVIGNSLFALINAFI